MGQPQPSIAGSRRIPLRPLTQTERSHYDRIQAQRHKSVQEDQQYENWLINNSGKYRQITGEFPPLPPRRISQKLPRVQVQPYQRLQPDISTMETMIGVPAIIPQRRPNPEDEVPIHTSVHSSTDKFNLDLIPLSVLIEARMVRVGRLPRYMIMNAINVLRLLQEGKLRQNCFNGHIPVHVDTDMNMRLSNREIIIEYPL